MENNTKNAYFICMIILAVLCSIGSYFIMWSYTNYVPEEAPIEMPQPKASILLEGETFKILALFPLRDTPVAVPFHKLDGEEEWWVRIGSAEYPVKDHEEAHWILNQLRISNNLYMEYLNDNS